MEGVSAVRKNLGRADVECRSGIQVLADTFAGFSRITLSNASIEAAFLPELGGKMTSLKRTATGREFLLQLPQRTYRKASYGDPFEDYDTSGFDECVPTVSGCEYPDGRFAGTALPDHGELWSMAWQCEERQGELWFAARGRSLPYLFRKRVRLENEAVVIGYELVSVSDEPFCYLWSAHPLLNVESGCRILLPAGTSRLLINSSHRNRLGVAGEECSFPVTEVDGRNADISVLGSRTERAADKLFAGPLAQGWGALYYPASDESIVYRFNAGVVPYLGMWICQGGWPDEDNGHFTVALEPCTSRFDSLAEAINKQECELLPPGQRSAGN